MTDEERAALTVVGVLNAWQDEGRDPATLINAMAEFCVEVQEAIPEAGERT